MSATTPAKRRAAPAPYIPMPGDSVTVVELSASGRVDVAASWYGTVAALRDGFALVRDDATGEIYERAIRTLCRAPRPDGAP